MKVLLTGINGFVGQYIAKKLKERGMEVIGIGRQEKSLVPTDFYMKHDITNSLLSLKGPTPDAVVHCAALSTPWERPEKFYKSNVEGTRNILNFSNDREVPYLLYISSSSVFYQEGDQFNISEQTKKPSLERQINTYSKTKLLGEELVKTYPDKWAILRPRAVFGPEDTVVFPRILRLAQEGKFPYFIRGDRKPVICDLTYVDVFAEYVVRSLEKKFQGDLNITNGTPVDLYQLLEGIFSKLNLSPKKKKIPVALGMFAAHGAELFSKYFLNYKEPPLTRYGVSVFAYSKTFDVSKSQTHLGMPPISLEEGIDRFLHWWKTQTVRV